MTAIVSKNLPVIALLIILTGCGGEKEDHATHQLAVRVRFETKRVWDAYQQYAWGQDLLLPFDAFSTLVVTGLTGDAGRVVEYVADSVNFNIDLDIKVLQVNTRILGGLISMYQLSGDKRLLAKAVDLGDRIMQAFGSPTGIPYCWVNLKSGRVYGNRVNVAEAGTYLLEMGMLSYFTGDISYYQAAKRSTEAIFKRRSGIGLAGDMIDVETGNWIKTTSHICAGTDSYYEYLFKGWLLFGDPDLKEMWDKSIEAVLRFLPERKDSLIWFGRVDMQTGERKSSVVTLRDASMPALLAVSGHLEEAEDLQKTWNWLWNRNGLVPMEYDYGLDLIIDPEYSLNPEIMESAWYLWELTGNRKYRDMLSGYFWDLVDHCRTGEAFAAIKNVVTSEQSDYMNSSFLAETLKYLYLAFADQEMFNLETTVFSAGAHPFLKAALDPVKTRENLALTH